MNTTASEGMVCKTNISPWGRRMRRNAGIGIAVVGVVLLGTLIAVDAAWWIRLVMFVPGAAFFITTLQLTRNTCVMHAAQGVEETDEVGKTRPAAPDDVAASRRVARTIYRDGALGGLAVALVSAATAIVF